jgi:hypothetical protein
MGTDIGPIRTDDDHRGSLLSGVSNGPWTSGLVFPHKLWQLLIL